MILGVGNDVVEIKRIQTLLEGHGARFEKRVYTESEIAYANSRNERKLRTLALRFAGKEAAAKALGTGFRDSVRLKDVEILSDEMGKPSLTFHGAALERLSAITPEGHVPHLHIALSDEGEFAWAVAVIEAIEK